MSLPENLRAVRAHLGAAPGCPDPARWALHGDVIGVEALQFGIEVGGKDPFLRGKLQGIGQRIVPLAQELLPGMVTAVRDSAVFSFMVHIQFGNGWRLHLLASRIRSGTRRRRWCSCSSSRSSAS